MSTLTIELSDDIAARLAAASEREHVPPAQIVQAALEKALPAPEEEKPAGRTLYDAMKEAGAIGCISTGIGDLSTNKRHMEGYGRSRK
jgi:predicted transcriptional regulator